MFKSIRSFYLLFLSIIFISPLLSFAEEEKSLYSFTFLYTIDGKTSGKPFTEVSDIFIDNDKEEIYINDSLAKRIVITNLEGIFLYTFHYVDTKIKTTVISMSVHENSEVYLAQADKITVCKYNGRFVRDLDLSSFTKKDGISISSIRFNGDLLYIGDQKNHRIIVFDVVKNEVVNIFSKDIELASRIALYDDGFIILEPGRHRVYKYDKRGNLVHKFGRISGLPGGFSQPVDLTVDNIKKHIIVTDFNRIAVILFNFDGEFIYEFGSESLFRIPSTVRVDNKGRLFVVDGEFVRVFKINEEKVTD